MVQAIWYVETDLQKQVVALLETMGPMTRGDMVRAMQVPRTTLYDTLAKLIAQNVVERDPVNNNKRGRPKVVFSLKGGIIAR